MIKRNVLALLLLTLCGCALGSNSSVQNHPAQSGNDESSAFGGKPNDTSDVAFWSAFLSLARSHDGYISQLDFEKAYGVKLEHEDHLDDWGANYSLNRKDGWYADAEYAEFFKRHKDLSGTVINPGGHMAKLSLRLPMGSSAPNVCVNARAGIEQLVQLGWSRKDRPVFKPGKGIEFIAANYALLVNKKTRSEITIYYGEAPPALPDVEVDPASACVNGVEIRGWEK